MKIPADLDPISPMKSTHESVPAPARVYRPRPIINTVCVHSYRPYAGADPGFVEGGGGAPRRKREALLGGSASRLIREKRGGGAPVPPLDPHLLCMHAVFEMGGGG